MYENILIIEDNDDINTLLKDILVEEGYRVRQAYSGTEGLLYIERENFNLILLDLMLPGKSGEEILEKVRLKSDIPIIIISAKEESGIKGRLLRSGADDFISKPFEIDEVLGRVIATLRRCKANKKNGKLKFREISIDEEEMIIKVNEKEIKLTATEYEILKLFISYPNKVFSKDNLYKSIWGEDAITDDNTITVHISNIRNKIKKAGAKESYFKTVWGIGYKLNSN